MIITIDGPAGAGKSSAARRLAKRLGFRFLDTGAMYRIVAYAALQRGISWDDFDGLSRLANDIAMDISEDHVLMDGVDVTREIRAMHITAVTHHVADHPGVRATLVTRQRRWADGGNYVTEGRDQGTVAFPQAECKIFLTASPEERARRRIQDIHARGEQATFAEVLRLQNDRDEQDRTRRVGRLQAAPDAEIVSTDGMELDQVVDRLEAIARRHICLDRAQ
jgi:cytidylate kinase